MKSANSLMCNINVYNKIFYVHLCTRLCSSLSVGRGYVLRQLDDGYDPSKVERGKYAEWEREGRFVAGAGKGDAFSLVLPPPNITGDLHLGHALTTVVQDALARWTRMRGREVSWLPGMDHAGIATQAVVERALLMKGTSRHSLGREKFRDEVWKWKEEHGGRIREQLKALGATLDWSREVFTMDATQSRAVKHAFVRLFDEGSIYRANHLVNWSCALRSTISDIEVENLNVEGPMDVAVPGYPYPVKFGYMTEFAYKLEDGDGEIIVSTTRPETMLGDTGVAVNVNDYRYNRLIGCRLNHPFTNKTIPVIGDESVDMNFGTGAVKITPAHDRNDYQLSTKHNLAMVPVIDESGHIADGFGTFSGLKRYIARDLMLKELEGRGLLRGLKDHTMVLPVCSRSGDVVELLPRWQWYVDCKEMNRHALEAVKTGNLKLIPNWFEDSWCRWLEESKDWCISRQLWWGHRIPAYRCYSRNYPDKTVWIAAVDDKEALERAKVQLGNLNDIVCEQDTDVLDTWFSSGLYPFSCFGWPDNTADSKNFYPLDLLITGHDILCFWVLRMVMLGARLTGKLPFPAVLLHGVICDADGSKMSKSKGNVVDPDDVIRGVSLKELNDRSSRLHKMGTLSEKEYAKALTAQRKKYPHGIPTCGADSLRFTLCNRNIKNHHIHFDVDECYNNKLFGNKIWQSLKYYRNALVTNADRIRLEECKRKDLGLVDLWILSRLSHLVQTVNESLEEYNFHTATDALKLFLYNEMCDTYIECTKRTLKSNLGDNATELAAHFHTFAVCYHTALRCLTPFMPYLTQELIPAIPMNDRLIFKYEDSISHLVFPVSGDFEEWRDEKLEDEMRRTCDIVSVVRQLKNTYKISNKSLVKVHVECANDDVVNTTHKFDIIIRHLARIENLKITKFGGCQTSDIWNYTDKNNCKIFLEMPTKVEGVKRSCVDREKLLKKRERYAKTLEKLEELVNTEKYIRKVSDRKKLADDLKIKTLKESIVRLNIMTDTN